MTIESQIVELKRQIEVMQAYQGGAAIEFRLNHISDAKWDIGGPPGHFDWQSFDYRVKPKKRELLVGFDADGKIRTVITKPQEGVTFSVDESLAGCTFSRFVEAD